MLVLISQAIMAICLSLLGLEHKQGKRTADEDLFNLQTKDKTQIKKKKGKLHEFCFAQTTCLSQFS